MEAVAGAPGFVRGIPPDVQHGTLDRFRDAPGLERGTPTTTLFANRFSVGRVSGDRFGHALGVMFSLIVTQCVVVRPTTGGHERGVALPSLGLECRAVGLGFQAGFAGVPGTQLPGFPLIFGRRFFVDGIRVHDLVRLPLVTPDFWRALTPTVFRCYPRSVFAVTPERFSLLLPISCFFHPVTMTLRGPPVALP